MLISLFIQNKSIGENINTYAFLNQMCSHTFLGSSVLQSTTWSTKPSRKPLAEKERDRERVKWNVLKEVLNHWWPSHGCGRVSQGEQLHMLKRNWKKLSLFLQCPAMTRPQAGKAILFINPRTLPFFSVRKLFMSICHHTGVKLAQKLL